MEKTAVNQFFIEKFLSYNLHCGSSRKVWKTSSRPFLQGVRHDFCILNLSETRSCLRQGIRFLIKLFSQKKKILFVGAPKGVEKEFATLCLNKKHYWIEKWPHGFFTNSEVFLSSKKNPPLQIEENPSLIFVFNLDENEKMKEEAWRLDIPLMAFVNTDEDLENIDYPIPANVRSWKGGLFVYNLFFHLFSTCQKNND